MKKEIFAASMAMLLSGGAFAQERNVQLNNNEEMKTEQTEEKKDGFLKRAFRDMKESAKLQHKIDKANYEATKLESKAFYQEQKRLSNPKVRTAEERKRMEQELQEVNERVEAAQAKLDSIKSQK